MKCVICKKEKELIFLDECKECFRLNYESWIVDDYVLMNDAGRVLHIDDIKNDRRTGFHIDIKVKDGRITPEDRKRFREILNSPEFKKRYLAWKMK